MDRVRSEHGFREFTGLLNGIKIAGTQSLLRYSTNDSAAYLEGALEDELAEHQLVC